MDIERIAAKKRNLQRRAEILRLIRQFFQEGYYLEVETPQLAPTPLPEAFIEPIATERGWLLPSPELYMKPLLAADFGNIFQICHTFRKGEKGIHNQEEFTLLEYYRIGHNYMQLAAKTEELVTFIAASLNNSTTISYQGQSIDLSPPWLRLSVSEAFTVACGWDPVVISDPERFDFELATTVAELSQTRPLVLYDFPAEMASLSRLKAADDKVAERAEIFIGGLELANIFSELTDPIEQRRRFITEIETAKIYGRQSDMPEGFLKALESLPESAGGALGIDRLAMLFCDAATIDQVTAFPA